MVWRALGDGMGIMIGGDTDAHIWEFDGCENENSRRMKESINEMGLQILNCVWDESSYMVHRREEVYTGLCVYVWKRHEESCGCQYT